MIAGIFGMNTPSTIFDSDGYGRAPHFGFPLVALLICGIVLLLVIAFSVWLYCAPRFGKAKPPSTALRAEAAHQRTDTSAHGDRASAIVPPRDATSGGAGNHAGNSASSGVASSHVARLPTPTQRRESRVHTLKELLLKPNSSRGPAINFLRSSQSGVPPPSDLASDTELAMIARGDAEAGATPAERAADSRAAPPH